MIKRKVTRVCLGNTENRCQIMMIRWYVGAMYLLTLPTSQDFIADVINITLVLLFLTIHKICIYQTFEKNENIEMQRSKFY